MHYFKRKTYNQYYLTIIILIFVNVFLSESTLSPTRNKDKIRDVKRGPIDVSVFDRNLISDKPNSKEILRENQAYFENTDVKNFNGTILGYVTPVSIFRNYICFISHL